MYKTLVVQTLYFYCNLKKEKGSHAREKREGNQERLKNRTLREIHKVHVCITFLLLTTHFTAVESPFDKVQVTPKLVMHVHIHTYITRSDIY